ncbi:UNVERIFIED_ORG: hypothetical protein GGD51_000514 [Rhizobium esperanzae]
MPDMIASNFPTVSAGMIPSQSWGTKVHSTFIRRQRSRPTSTSKPANWPSAAIAFQGGEAPSEAIVSVFLSIATALLAQMTRTHRESAIIRFMAMVLLV